jgi:hypothetical protein
LGTHDNIRKIQATSTRHATQNSPRPNNVKNQIENAYDSTEQHSVSDSSADLLIPTSVQFKVKSKKKRSMIQAWENIFPYASKDKEQTHSLAPSSTIRPKSKYVLGTVPPQSETEHDEITMAPVQHSYFPRAFSANDQTANRKLVIRAINETDKISQKQQKELREFNDTRMYEALDVIRTIHIAHFDNGAMTSTTHYSPALWHYRPFDLYDPPPQPLEVADQGTHTPVGFGFLRIPSTETPGHSMVFSLYTPSISATIVSPYALGLQYRARGYTVTSDFNTQVCAVTIHLHERTGDDIIFPLHPIRGMLYSEPLIFPNDIQHAEPSPPELWDRIPNITNPVTSPPYIRQITQHQEGKQTHQCSSKNIPTQQELLYQHMVTSPHKHYPNPHINNKHRKKDLKPD